MTIAELARGYVAFLNVAGLRFQHRETTLFCEAVEAMNAPEVKEAVLEGGGPPALFGDTTAVAGMEPRIAEPMPLPIPALDKAG